MNTDIKDYQQKVADILARDYFTREEGYTLRTDTVGKNNGVPSKDVNSSQLEFMYISLPDANPTPIIAPNIKK